LKYVILVIKDEYLKMYLRDIIIDYRGLNKLDLNIAITNLFK